MIRKALCGKVLKFEPQLPELALLDRFDNCFIILLNILLTINNVFIIFLYHISFEACGGKLWPASDVLVQFLSDDKKYEFTKNRNVLGMNALK
jgi:hypothetical protein